MIFPRQQIPQISSEPAPARARLRPSGFQAFRSSGFSSRAFTLIEVMLALLIAAAMSVTIVLAYVNILGGYQTIQRRPARDLDLTTARNALLAEADYDTAQKGDQFDGATGRHVAWSAQIDPTTTADLFQVTFTCQLTGGTDSNGNTNSAAADETITEIFRVLRPTWSQGTDSATLRQANKDRIMQSPPQSPLSGIVGGDGVASASSGAAGKGKNSNKGGGGSTGKGGNTGKGGGPPGKNTNGKNGAPNGKGARPGPGGPGGSNAGFFNNNNFFNNTGKGGNRGGNGNGGGNNNGGNNGGNNTGGARGSRRPPAQ